jgi:ketosteroid isomerase-like protein
VDHGAIARARGDFVEALRVGDATAASAVYAADATLLAPSAEVFAGRAAIAAFWRAGLDAGIAGIELEELTIAGGEGVAWEIGRYTLHIEPADGRPVVDRGKYLVVHELQEDGLWSWAVEMFNPDAPSAGSGGRLERGRSSDVEAQTRS